MEGWGCAPVCACVCHVQMATRVRGLLVHVDDSPGWAWQQVPGSTGTHATFVDLLVK